MNVVLVKYGKCRPQNYFTIIIAGERTITITFSKNQKWSYHTKGYSTVIGRNSVQIVLSNEDFMKKFWVIE